MLMTDTHWTIPHAHRGGRIALRQVDHNRVTGGRPGQSVLTLAKPKGGRCRARMVGNQGAGREGWPAVSEAGGTVVHPDVLDSAAASRGFWQQRPDGVLVVEPADDQPDLLAAARAHDVRGPDVARLAAWRLAKHLLDTVGSRQAPVADERVGAIRQ